MKNACSTLIVFIAIILLAALLTPLLAPNKVSAQQAFGRIIRLSGGVCLIGGVRLGGTSPIPCSQAANFLARTSGLNATHTNAYTTLICGLVTDGIWNTLDALWIPATQNSTTATLNLVSTSYTLTPNGSDSFTADAGYSTAAGTGNYIATGYNTGLGTNFTQNSAEIYMWNQKTNTGACEMGDGNDVDLNAQTFGPSGEINDTSSLGLASNQGNGWNSIDRNSASARDYYFDGISVASDTHPSVALSSNSLILGGEGGTTGGGTCVLGAAGVGGSLDAVHQASFYSLMSTYMTAVGAN
jgi:hypothetical protein